MTDSENETTPGIFPFPNVDTTVNALGPNIRFQRPFRFPTKGSSSMYMPRQNYAESVSEQRSLYYRRETSPMSTYSALDTRAWNFPQYYNGMRSTQSVFNGRCGSSMSVRSIDSTASASVADIIFAFKNNKFNRHDERAIEEAFRKWRKQRSRKRIQIRRNMKFNLKDSKCREDYDSGEQGSDSSISSHNSHSETISYKENRSRPVKMDILDSRKAIKDTNPIISQTQSFRQHTAKNIFSINNNSCKRDQNFKSVVSNPPHIATQQERFKNALTLPCQRFNSTMSSSVIHNKSEICKKSKETNNSNNKQNEKFSSAVNDLTEDKSCESDSEEEIFSGTNRTIREKIAHDWILQNQNRSHEHQNKRHRNNSDDDVNLPNGKKFKTLSPAKNSQLQVASKARDINPVNNIHNKTNFEFTKPLLPVRKPKTKLQGKVISKQLKISPIKFIAHNNEACNSDKAKENSQENVSLEKPHGNAVDHTDNLINQSSDVSMRPSFIKRKLFTQNLDIAEKANISNESVNTPQKNVYTTMKEKNKARKVVTTQSCLNRDIQEDNNYLDLIHKIVPASSINVTNQNITSQIKEKSVAKVVDDDDDKWDVASVISVCNENDGSDTFTDEDIFKVDNKKTDKDINTNKKQSNNIQQKIYKNTNAKCVVNLQKIDFGKHIKVGEKLNVNKCVLNLIPNKKTVLSNSNLCKNTGNSFAKKFWESDFETDVECEMTVQKSRLQENQTRDNSPPAPPKPEQKQPVSPVETSLPSKSLAIKNKISNNILDSTGKLNINLINVRSHRTSKKKKCCNETHTQEIASKPQGKNTTPKIQINNIQTTKTITPKKSNKNAISDQKTNTVSQNNRNKKTETPKRSRNTQKIKSNANKENIYKYLLASPIRRSPRIKLMKENHRPQRSCRTSGSAVI